MKIYGVYFIKVLIDLLWLAPMFAIALIARFKDKPLDVGLGPEPLINYIYHKKALELAGFTSETYVVSTNYITDTYDYQFPSGWLLAFPFRWHLLFVRAVFRYRCLYFSFHGGPLMGTSVLRWLEPFLLKLADIRTVILPYGSDVQEMTRCANLAFRNAIACDYPTIKGGRKRISDQIDRWTMHASHIVSGCDWVDYMPYWDTISLSNFSIDTDLYCPMEKNKTETIRILHSPNHRFIKGTDFFVRAVNELCDEGLEIELIVLERASNVRIQQIMSTVDIVADQLIIGWYAMFALEAMAMGKPVLCFIRKDLEDFYVSTGLLKEGELPLVNCSTSTIKDVLSSLIKSPNRINQIGIRSREFVLNHHSLKAIGSEFNRINRSIGILPSQDVNFN